MTEFEEKVAALRQHHEELLSRKNCPRHDETFGTFHYAHNGIYEKYQYPILTAEHTPLEWRYDFCEKDNPFLMQRIMMNATLNSGALKWKDKYVVVVRVEGADRKSFFAVAESPNGVDNFRFWPEPITMPEAPSNSPEGGEPGSAQTLTELCTLLEQLDDFSLQNQEKVVHAWIEEKGYKLGNVMNAWRLALVGEGKGPGMFDISAFLGKDETLRRTRRAIEELG